MCRISFSVICVYIKIGYCLKNAGRTFITVIPGFHTVYCSAIIGDNRISDGT